MAGEIKTLNQPQAAQGYVAQITPLEWFRCTYEGTPCVAMLTADPKLDRRSARALVIDKNGVVDNPTLNRFMDARPTFLGYLTTEESVTIHGSLDPNWVEPELKPIVVPPDPADPLDLEQVAIGVPFYYHWTADRMDCVGLKLRAADKTEGGWTLLRINRNNRGDQGHIPSTSYIPRVRLFERYVPDEIGLFKNHRYKDYAIYEGIL